MKTLSQLTPEELEHIAKIKRQIAALVEAAEKHKEAWFVECAVGANGLNVSVDPRDVDKICAMLTDRLEYEVDKVTGYAV